MTDIREAEKNLSLERLKDVLHYDPETGQFTWLIRPFGGRVHPEGIAGGSGNNGYWKITVDGNWFYAHRLAWFYMDGEWPNQIDHIDHDGMNNRTSNLRDVTGQENKRNGPLQKNNKSGVTGVCWNKKYEKWVATIRVDGKSIYLGQSVNFDRTVEKRKEAELKYGFHPNHGAPPPHKEGG